MMAHSNNVFSESGQTLNLLYNSFCLGLNWSDFPILIDDKKKKVVDYDKFFLLFFTVVQAPLFLFAAYVISNLWI